jgi:hypothetical protein
MASSSPLDAFGSLVSISLRDAALRRAEALLNNSLKSPSTDALRKALQEFAPQQLNTLRALVCNCVDSGIHDFLFKLQELSDGSESIKVLVNGHDVAALSDGLHGEPYSADGWYARYSAFPE